MVSIRFVLKTVKPLGRLISNREIIMAATQVIWRCDAVTYNPTGYPCHICQKKIYNGSPYWFKNTSSNVYCTKCKEAEKSMGKPRWNSSTVIGSSGLKCDAHDNRYFIPINKKYWWLRKGGLAGSIHCQDCYELTTGTQRSTDVSEKLKFVECGTAPTEVQCACFGFRTYTSRVRTEIDKWIPYLKRCFGEPPANSRFSQHETKHEVGGFELTVRFYYNQYDESHIKYTCRLIDEMPKNWDDTLKDCNQEETLQVDESDWWTLKEIRNNNGVNCPVCNTKIIQGDPYRKGISERPYYKTAHSLDSIFWCCPSCYEDKVKPSAHLD